MKKSTLFLAALALFASLRAGALELSLEENKGESGTIGYVDIDRVFKNFSGTSNARSEFLAEIKAKEDSLNLKKQAIFSLKADIAKLKQEREFALTLPGLMRQAEEISAAVVPADNSSPVVPSVSAQAPLSTGAVKANIPAGISTQTAAIQLSTGPALINLSAGVSSSSPAALPAGLPGMAGIDMPGVSRVPVNYFKFSVSTSAAEIDSAITAKETDLAKKQEDLRLSQRQTERELLEYETHKSEMILGRIYLALKELAVKEGVSVVVDKRTILFGHSAVDLTGKLIEKLEESPI
jgi:Skp family chaperone for outer membrane proteins